MAGPGALLLLGGLLGGLPQIRGGSGGARGVPGGSESPAELEEEVSIVQRSDPHPPHCFSRTLHDLSCFWDSPGAPDPRRYRLQFRLEQDPWQDCPLSATALSPPGRGSRFWCSLPPAATVTFVPLELRVLPGTPPGTPPETTGTPPKSSGTTESTGTPPETTRTPPKSSGTTETTGTPPETTGTPPKTSGTTETTGTPPETTETTRTPPETTGTTETPPKSSGTTGTPPETTGTPPGPPPAVAEPPPPAPPALFQRTLFIDQVVLPGPPQNVSVSAGGARGELCVRWAPPPGPYLHSSLVFELALSPPGGPPKTVGVPAGRREQGVGGLRASTPYRVRARARPDGLSYGGFWSPWSPPASATTPPELDAVTLGLSCLLVLLLLGLGALGLLGHRRTLWAKLWPPVPGPEREFEGLFSNYGGNFQLWLCQSPGSPCAPPAPPTPPAEAEDAGVVGGGGAAGGEGLRGLPPLRSRPPPAPRALPEAPPPPQAPPPRPASSTRSSTPAPPCSAPPPARQAPPPTPTWPRPPKGPSPSGRGTPPITSSAPEGGRVTSHGGAEVVLSYGKDG